MTQRPAPEQLARVRMLAFDVDGVLTDARLSYDDGGGTAHSFHVRDGLALVRAVKAGLPLAAISGRRAVQVARRLRELRVHQVRQGVDDKDACLRSLCGPRGVDPADVAYIGDDVVDLPVFRIVGVSACPCDADPAVLRFMEAHGGWVIPHKGGRGAVREVVEAILRAQGRWQEEG
ncbi:MAG: phenylphosphate carboxylase subunit delta [Deltaproteobacteria bacterium]|nr:phenylphosphate carboxylase subunit delta [Deltaproteobacteria bacterium]